MRRIINVLCTTTSTEVIAIIPTIPYTNYTLKLDRIAISISADYIKKSMHSSQLVQHAYFSIPITFLPSDVVLL